MDMTSLLPWLHVHYNYRDILDADLPSYANVNLYQNTSVTSCTAHGILRKVLGLELSVKIKLISHNNWIDMTEIDRIHFREIIRDGDMSNDECGVVHFNEYNERNMALNEVEL